ncbi:PTS transporter subunit EIIB [Klebsiella pneumoniae subsp. pneumoniae]|nr:PTS transporter subunit EIIB [Klebsiella pneumoniae subsp. pneumoniae]
MSKVNQQDIDKLIELVGGRGNIATVSHCNYPFALCAERPGHRQTKRD